MADEEDNSIKQWKIDEKAEVEDGDAEITFDIPEEIDTMGEHVITAEYLENWKYRASSVSRELYLGYHTYVHCPVIYIYKSQLKNLELVSNLFSNNRPVTGCSGKFKINKTTVCDKIPITDGHVSYNYDGSSLGGTPLYMFKTAGKVSANINPGESNQAEIIIQDIETQYTALVVSVPTVMTGNNQEIPVIARVYKLLHSSVIDQSDIPNGGTMTFYLAQPGTDSAMVNNELYYLGMADVSTSGYAHITASADIVTGVYTIIAVYDPPEWTSKYVQTVGSGTLYYSDTLIRPEITTSQRFVYNEGDDVSAEFTSDVPLTGTIELYIDEQIVTSMKVSEKSSFEFDFDIPLKPETDILWAYPGVHLLMIRYRTNDGYIHDYYFDFIIRYDTEVLLDHPQGFLDNAPEISHQSYTFTYHVLNLNLTTDEHTVYVPSGNLYINMYRSRPIFYFDEDLLMFNNDEVAEFTFTSDMELTGTITLLLDGVEIHTMEVEDATEITPTFIVPSKENSYAYPGEHTLTIAYTRADRGTTVSWDYDCIIRYGTAISLVRLLNENGNPITVKYTDRTLYTEGNPLEINVDNVDDPSLLPVGYLNLDFFPFTTLRPPKYTCRDDVIINNDEVSNLTFDVDQYLTGTIKLYIDDIGVEDLKLENENCFTTSFICNSTTDTGSYRYPGEHVLKIAYRDVDNYDFISEVDLRIRYNVDLTILNISKDESTGVAGVTNYEDYPYLRILAWNRELDEPVNKGVVNVTFQLLESASGNTGGDDEPKTRKAVSISLNDVDAHIGDIVTLTADISSEDEVNEGTVKFRLNN